MNSDKINKILENSEHNGIEIYVVLNNNGKKIIKMLNANVELRDALQKRLEDNLKSKYLDKEVEYKQLNEYLRNEDSYCVIDKKAYDGLDFICDLENVNESYLSDDGNIQGFVFKYGTFSNYLIGYEHFYPINLIKKDSKGTIMIVMDIIGEKPQFKLYNNDLIKINAKIEVLILGDEIITDNLKLLENKFGFQDYIEKEAKIVAKEINDMNIIDGFDKFNECMQELNFKKGLTKIKNSPVLALRNNTLIERISKVEYYKNRLKIENDKIKVTSKKDAKIVVKLLGDDILQSPITESIYDSSAKIKLEV